MTLTAEDVATVSPEVCWALLANRLDRADYGEAQLLTDELRRRGPVIERDHRLLTQDQLTSVFMWLSPDDEWSADARHFLLRRVQWFLRVKPDVENVAWRRFGF